MKQSTSRILTTHTGSLPRTGSVAGLLETRDSQGQVDPQAFESGADEAVTEGTEPRELTQREVVDPEGRTTRVAYVDTQGREVRRTKQEVRLAAGGKAQVIGG